jgi:hypothetical protein
MKMQCASENFVEREFVANGDPDDYTCTHCGWCQFSTEDGAAELCLSATWHSVKAYERYRDIARAGSRFAVPDAPPHFEP